jgi:hypothetical protein
MAMQMGLWRIDGTIERVKLGDMPSEEQLESLLEKDPSILGERLLILGRQVPTHRGKRMDILAMDSEGTLRVLELKRGKTPRDAVAQILEYGAWVQQLSHDDVIAIYTSSNPTSSFEESFESVFGFSAPEELNQGHKLTLVATEIDEDSQSIIEYLDSAYAVPINVVFFRYFKDGDHEYIARQYLIEEQQEPTGKAGKAGRTRESWNGLDWYVAFDRSWEDAMRLGFVSAGGGDWYSNTLKNVPEGARVWACVPKTGYVGVGRVTGPAKVLADSHVAGAKDLEWDFIHGNGEDEWFLPVTWEATKPLSEAVWKKGMFANQNSACKLRNSFTLSELHIAFGVQDDV